MFINRKKTYEGKEICAAQMNVNFDACDNRLAAKKSSHIRCLGALRISVACAIIKHALNHQLYIFFSESCLLSCSGHIMCCICWSHDRVRRKRTSEWLLQDGLWKMEMVCQPSHHSYCKYNFMVLITICEDLIREGG
jgi:hypothetical protein